MSLEGEHLEGVRTELKLSIAPSEQEFRATAYLKKPQGSAYLSPTLRKVPEDALDELLKDRPERATLLTDYSFWSLMLDFTVLMEDPTRTYLDWARFRIEIEDHSKILLVAPEEVSMEAKYQEYEKVGMNITPTGKVSILDLAEIGVDAEYTSERGWTFEVPVNIKRYSGGRAGERGAVFDIYGFPEHVKSLNAVGESSIFKGVVVLQIPVGERPKMMVNAEGKVTKEDALLWIDISGSIELKSPGEVEILA